MEPHAFILPALNERLLRLVREIEQFQAFAGKYAGLLAAADPQLVKNLRFMGVEF